MCAHKEVVGKVKVQRVEKMKVDELKQLHSAIQSNSQHNKRGEGEGQTDRVMEERCMTQ